MLNLKTNTLLFLNFNFFLTNKKKVIIDKNLFTLKR